MGLSFYEVGIGPNEMFVFLFLKSEYKSHLIFLINKKNFEHGYLTFISL